MKRRGFTLIELLVVVSIIAILVAMIVPVMIQAKEATKMRVCAVNMHHLGEAILHYVDDNDGYGLPKPPAGYKNSWVLCIEPLLHGYLPYSLDSVKSDLPPLSCDTNKYIPQPNWIWVCSGDIDRGDKDTPFWKMFGSSYMYPGTTAYLSGEANANPNSIAEYPRKILMWKNHHRDMLLADYWFDFHSGNKVAHNFTNSIFPTTLVSKSHSRGINVLFLDMHLSTVSMSERIGYQNYTIYDDNPNNKTMNK